jgi:hypothetical protein
VRRPMGSPAPHPSSHRGQVGARASSMYELTSIGMLGFWRAVPTGDASASSLWNSVSNQAAERLFEERRASAPHTLKVDEKWFAFTQAWLQELLPEFGPTVRSVPLGPAGRVPRETVSQRRRSSCALIARQGQFPVYQRAQDTVPVVSFPDDSS